MRTLVEYIRAGLLDCVMIDMLAQVSDNPADLMAFFDLCAKRSVDVYNGADELPPPVASTSSALPSSGTLAAATMSDQPGPGA
jgi:hypothetical protein